MSWSGRHRPDWDNDVSNYGAIDSLELENIHCPVLLIHGDADTDALPEYSYTAINAYLIINLLLWQTVLILHVMRIQNHQLFKQRL